MAYAGALEPTDETQLGPHGYIRGTVDEHGTRIQFVPFARYEYEDLVLNVTEDLTQYALETKLKQELALREDGKIRKIIRLKLVGHRAAELEFLRNGCWTAAESSPWRMKHVRRTIWNS